MKLLVHIVTHRRRELIEKCLVSVIQALPENADVSIVLNGSDGRTREFLSGIDDPRVSWEEVTHESLSASRNRAFQAKGYDVIHYLDDDVTIPKDLFTKTLDHFSKDSALAIVGGPNLTPSDSSFWERVFGASMTSPFCAPGVCRRYGGWSGLLSLGDSDAFIFCNLAIRVSLIPKDLRFQIKLSSNQENLFLFDAIARSLKAMYASENYVFHRRRKSISRFSSQIVSYGRGRWEQTVERPNSLEWKFVVPSVAVLVGLSLVIAAEGQQILWKLGAAHLALGFVSGLGLSYEVRRLPIIGIALIPLITMVVHAAYGIGFLSSMLGYGLKYIPRAFSEAAGRIAHKMHVHTRTGIPQP